MVQSLACLEQLKDLELLAWRDAGLRRRTMVEWGVLAVVLLRRATQGLMAPHAPRADRCPTGSPRADGASPTESHGGHTEEVEGRRRPSSTGHHPQLHMRVSIHPPPPPRVAVRPPHARRRPSSTTVPHPSTGRHGSGDLLHGTCFGVNSIWDQYFSYGILSRELLGSRPLLHRIVFAVTFLLAFWKY
jgi:hypothetical protein